MFLQTTLTLTAAAAFINIWHMLRIGRLRASEKIAHGDGGNTLLLRRMRAQANFIESTPLVLILIAVIEASAKGGAWLAIAGALFMVGRVTHPIGMDTEGNHWGRMIGALTAMLALVGLAIMAVLIALGRF